LFGALGAEDITVQVGPRTSSATLRLAGPKEVREALGLVLAAGAKRPVHQ